MPHVGQLATTYPDLEVDADALYTMDGTVITSAGRAAGIDARLSLVRQEHGPEVAARIARRMVVAPHRDGGQQQFIERAVVPASESTSLPLESVAGRVGRSSVTLLRHHVTQTVGIPPSTCRRRFAGA